MTKPLDKITTTTKVAINPRERRAFSFVVEKFDAVQKLKDSKKFKFKQMCMDL